MIKCREFMSITDEEIKFIIDDILKPKKIENICRDYEYKQISCDITTTWSDGIEEDIDITDEIILTLKEIEVYDFSFSLEDNWKYKQYLVSKGINALFKDNLYLR